jgi:hypothetical protein
MKLAFRNVTARDDRQFVVSNWSASFKKSHSAGMIWTEDWAAIMHGQIDRVLDRPDATTLVAFEATDPTFLYGWISGDVSEAMPVVFYCYVKESFRREGVARKLFERLGVNPRAPFVYVCQTPTSIRLSSKVPSARYNPLEVRYPKEARRAPWQTRP